MGQYQSTLITSHNKFASSLFQSITTKNKQTNIIFSPISIYLTVLMATGGSNGQTLSEFGKGIFLDQSPSTVEVFRLIIEPFASNFFDNLNTSIINVANNVFVERNAILNENYKEHVQKAFQVNVEQCDFAGNANGEAVNINQWVSSHTNQKINNLIPPNHLNSLTRLVLVNAVHFLGKWKEVFNISNSYTTTFHGAGGDSTCTIMQKERTKEQYGAEGLYHWVTMSFNDAKYKLTIVAVKDNSHQTTFDDWFSKKLSQGFESGFPTRETQMHSCGFPRFELEQGMELNEILQASPFNIQKAFTTNADFSNLIVNDQIHINAVIHKAYIKVNENGAEAGAALSMDCATFSIVKNPEFLVTSPFAFILTDDSTKSILFAGKVNTL
ncbi:predicted protein [Naegleria gruberi]|uniref:Predicted protein n=1 Tax=Naegleria gruberi TaxID=5762 RepID=D2V4S2_NAEGR|nr:uncharacterized protein NAEGRDRAFT_63889 [Naegleria gruberi]EFC47983.1 predicted protein [Naegleria gruberi]|eukprot:XP_002680727.1 predicted protein [Naegleria gruberi strain NEG-M]